jgi:hypothetical protein
MLPDSCFLMCNLPTALINKGLLKKSEIKKQQNRVKKCFFSIAGHKFSRFLRTILQQIKQNAASVTSR